jgi:meso-butanediol dehydrogenase / (S,S)-butanediol dehydrogenase / diacetyl reductase
MDYRKRGDNMRLDGKVALITGGGTGIGAEIARRFTAEGARVCIAGLEQEMLDSVAGTLPAGTVATYEGNVSNPDDVEKMVSTTIKFGGKVDVLVNNAGLGLPGGIVDISLEDWHKVLNVNLTGPFMLMKATIPIMIKAGGGSIVNISSIAGLRTSPEKTSYCTSKAALIMLSQTAAADYGQFKIRCNVICPGATRTDQLKMGVGEVQKYLNTDLEGAIAAFTACSPLKRAAYPSEIAAVCCFLASDDSSFMTGAVVPVDGGSVIVDSNGLGINLAAKK